jgi:hypothetical protein
MKEEKEELPEYPNGRRVCGYCEKACRVLRKVFGDKGTAEGDL